jgi:hypothetical protein
LAVASVFSCGDCTSVGYLQTHLLSGMWLSVQISEQSPISAQIAEESQKILLLLLVEVDQTL